MLVELYRQRVAKERRALRHVESPHVGNTGKGGQRRAPPEVRSEIEGKLIFLSTQARGFTPQLRVGTQALLRLVTIEAWKAAGANAVDMRVVREHGFRPRTHQRRNLAIWKRLAQQTQCGRDEQHVAQCGRGESRGFALRGE